MRKVIFLLLVLAAFAGCTTGAKLYKSTLLEGKRLNVDKKRGADKCVPYDLAMAETLVDIARLELESGNYIQAEEIMAQMDLHAAKAATKADSCIPKDQDKDGILDVDDRCPANAGPEKFKGCPDQDGDEVPDIDDKCIDVKGLIKLNGCPPAADRDKDGVPDATDRCPDDKGSASLKGCPDRDGDTVPDLDDRCPDVKGQVVLKGCLPAADRDKDGIPDSTDRCPDDKGLKQYKGCPDKDGDTIPDIDDKCPDVKGKVELNGCLPAADRDKDGTPDATDRCPDDKGPKEYKGCPDKDGDTIPDVEDKCPDVKGKVELKGCPPAADRDKDGIPDSQDRCPDDKGSVELKGCPDGDGDKVPDIDDLCPKKPGVIEKKGCPIIVDKDGDGILDKDDKCPDVPGVKEEKGCPKKYKLIVVTKKKIELKQMVFFSTGKAVIKRKSYKLLKEVADAIKNAPSIKKVIIEGHTDSSGSRRINLKLSQKRADAVREFLIDEGVDGSKLKAVGYGPDRPISSNRTRAGRAKNRRVEFILKQ